MCVRRETEEERSNEGQEERKEGLRRAGNGPGVNSIMKLELFECFAQILSGKNVISSKM